MGKGAAMPRRRVVIYTAQSARLRDQMVAWCIGAGYRVTAITDSPQAAKQTLWDGGADWLLIAREDHWRHLGDRVLVMGEQRAGPDRPRRLG